CMHALETPYSF
nr:immunoglobulin light chain junction region [Macaca mulatta]MOV92839.1 immunoglobulin light chain junction region [Macaca mulatta]MOV93380.1 immunoglobulin light chain junction region [Macaca mulatta]